MSRVTSGLFPWSVWSREVVKEGVAREIGFRPATAIEDGIGRFAK
jgi:hypothetical protein